MEAKNRAVLSKEKHLKKKRLETIAANTIKIILSDC